jgi:hypothetical protein
MEPGMKGRSVPPLPGPLLHLPMVEREMGAQDKADVSSLAGQDVIANG